MAAVVVMSTRNHVAIKYRHDSGFYCTKPPWEANLVHHKIPCAVSVDYRIFKRCGRIALLLPLVFEKQI